MRTGSKLLTAMRAEPVSSGDCIATGSKLLTAMRATAVAGSGAA